MDGEKIRNLIVTIFASGLFLLPALGLFRAPDPRMAAGEKRSLAPRPEPPRSLTAALAYPEGFNQYFNDNFAFRRQVIAWRNTFKVFYLGVSANKEVVLGKEGWLFYDAQRQLADHRGLRPLAPMELQQIIGALEARAALLASVKIPYLLVLVPEKHVIYPEYLPNRFTQVGANTRFDQIVNGLRASGRVHFLDLRPTLLAAKASGQIYFKYDTHWNPRGAFIAYRRVMEEVRKVMPAVPLLASHEVAFNNVPFPDPDLARFLALVSHFPEEEPRATIRAPQGHRDPRFAPLLASLSDPSQPESQHPFACSNPEGLGKMIFFGDSFSRLLVPYFSESFKEGLYFRGSMDAEIIRALLQQRFWPELVIEELVLRHI